VDGQLRKSGGEGRLEQHDDGRTTLCNQGLKLLRHRRQAWAGRILSGLAVLVFIFTGGFAVLKPAMAMQGFVHYGYPDGVLPKIIVTELVCALIYAIPRTSVLGAILLTGYLGGTTATHVRAGEPFLLPVIMGIVIWVGLFLREERLRALVPLRRSPPQ
jgi:hypothetical protein